MNRSKKERKVLRSAFTKAGGELQRLLEIEGPSQEDLRQIRVNWVLMEQKQDSLKILNRQIYDVLLEEDASEEDLTAESEACDSYEKRFQELKVACDEIQQGQASLLEDERSNSTERSNGMTGRRKFKLPKIEFKKFDGNIRDWLPFWAQFKKVDEDSDIDPSDKIEYLIQATVPGSRARRLVESFPAMGENYNKMVEALKSRFGREDLQIEVYVRELLKLILENAMAKTKTDLANLYDKIETQLRSLETLGITNDKYAAMLFPLIESCMPEEILRVWQRGEHRESEKSEDNADVSVPEKRLEGLMRFLRAEVENEQRISLASESFGLGAAKTESGKVHSRNLGKGFKYGEAKLPTAAGLINHDLVRCIFCEGSHDSESCFKAQEFSLERKNSILAEKKACFRCLKIGHQAKRCNVRKRCLLCGKSHAVLICPNLPSHKKEQDGKDSENKQDTGGKEHSLANSTRGHVFLETLHVKLIGENGTRDVRVLIDSGSQRSYILEATAKEMGYKMKRKETLIHCLFGGRQEEHAHDCFDVRLRYGRYACKFEALDQPTICSGVSPVFSGPWAEELKTLKISLNDKEPGPIEILIGSDVCGKLYTGRRHVLKCGLVAVETLLGWAISGKVPSERPMSNVVPTILSLFVKDGDITNLWRLDVLGISSPSEKKSSEEAELAAKEFFSQTVRCSEEGRYEVKLPWIEGHPPLPSNYHSAQKRLGLMVKKLRTQELLESYGKILEDWLEEGIIERVKISTDPEREGHYLPHRPVIRESSSTTKIRPVFDASAREKGGPSLNDCLEKGANLIEVIPSVILRFRECKIGVVSDIRKAFLQISLQESDRGFLRFLWMDLDGNEEVYRHRRVVFGVNSSPFLLGATVEHHLSELLKKCESESGEESYSRETIVKLAQSFYVDNCVTSVRDEDTMVRFIEEASMAMAEAKFDLRGWEHTEPSRCVTTTVPVLGLLWNPSSDVLKINGKTLQRDADASDKVVTKRQILSTAQKIFDPIGFTCPATLLPKILLQQTWAKQLSWDTPVDADTGRVFGEWLQELHFLQRIEIPRWVHAGPQEADKWSFHTFCDASKSAYAAVVFLRVEKDAEVFVYLLAAKSRVSPLKGMTIPRLELLAATIGARMWKSVCESLGIDAKSFFWSDSSTVLAWIRREEQWATFVWNRVAEIRTLTSAEDWRHVPGSLNPADLPSRGCTPKRLVESRWWEGPKWLYESEDRWFQESQNCDEDEINQERKKSVCSTLVNESPWWYAPYFSSYHRIVRMIAWLFHFVKNCRTPEDARSDTLTSTEIRDAEICLEKLIQEESFSGKDDPRITSLQPFVDEKGVLRLRSRVSRRDDFADFRQPIVLPGRHPVVERLVRDYHLNNDHVGVQGLASLLREHYWILGGRRPLRSVTSKCARCRRYRVKHFETVPPPLPLDRVREASAFEITGVDLAGPVFLKGSRKAWICLFTCGVYRAVHLECVTSLSTDSFVQALRRFVARRGRPHVIYSDRGTNFIGTDNAFRALDWESIGKYCEVRRIDWKFNPPTAAWWGGWWERLIGLMKQLLRRVLGRASLSYEELSTVLCDAEAVMNSRPITYVSNDPSELLPLTPAMFIQDIKETGVPDCDSMDTTALSRRLQYRQRLRLELRSRFRSEYLGQLRHVSKKKPTRVITVGEVVLVGSDNSKRLDWPLARVVELLPGKDGQIRLVRVKTARGDLLRPIQRLYPLECDDVPEGQESTETTPLAAQQSGVLNEESVPVNDRASAGVEGNIAGQRADITRSGRDRAGVKGNFAGQRTKITRSGRQVQLPSKLRN